MKAMMTASGELLIRHGHVPLITRPVPTSNPRGLVDAANARLCSVGIHGDSAQAWAVRRRIAADVAHAVAKEFAL